MGSASSRGATWTSGGRSGTIRRSSRLSGRSSPAGGTPRSARRGERARRSLPRRRSVQERDGPVRARGLRPVRPAGRSLPHRQGLGRPSRLAGRPPRGHPPRLAGAKGPAPGIPEGRDGLVPRARGPDQRRDRGVAPVPYLPPGSGRHRGRKPERAVLDLDLSRQRGPVRMGRPAPQGLEHRVLRRGRRPLRPPVRIHAPRQPL